jgi:hypothetical protein
MVALNSKGEVADFADVSQMEPGESEFACGFFSVSECKFAGEAGKGPKGSPEDVDHWADSQGGATTGGVSIDDMHNLLHAAGLHYCDTDISPNTQQSHDIATIKAALQRGYPVVATVAETSVFDLDLNGNPYAPNWTPGGNHVFVYTGVASDGNLLVHDNAAIRGGIFGKIAPQPRHYRASSLENHWASIVQLPWLPPIESSDPLSWKGKPQVTQPTTPQQPPTLPGGWHTADQEAIAKAEWNSTNTGAPFDSGIALAWAGDYQNGIFHGPPLGKEQAVKSWDGHDMIMQVFAGVRCEWTGTAHWYSFK